MPQIPAICSACGTAFRSGIVIENGRNISMSGVQSGPCPNCGGVGTVPDGIYDVLGDTVHVIATSGYSRATLSRLASRLTAAMAAQASVSEVSAIVQEEAPALSTVADKLLSNRAGALYTLIAMLVAVIQLAASLAGSDSVSEHDVARIVGQAMSQVQHDDRPTAAPPRRSAPQGTPQRKRRQPKTHHKRKKRKRR